jgi:hypothetical protein
LVGEGKGKIVGRDPTFHVEWFVCQARKWTKNVAMGPEILLVLALLHHLGISKFVALELCSQGCVVA